MSQSWRVLAVDDDKDILELIRISLMEQYEVFTFHEPMVAYQSLETVEPDLVILDIMMPKMTGYQIVEMMKQNRKFHDIPIVFLSAKDANRDIKYGYKLGAAVYLTKPFQPDRLLRNISGLFASTPMVRKQKKHSARQLEQILSMSDEFGLQASSYKGGMHIEPRPTASAAGPAPAPPPPPRAFDPDFEDEIKRASKRAIEAQRKLRERESSEEPAPRTDPRKTGPNWLD